MLAEVGMKQHHARFMRACLELLAQQRDRLVLAAIVDVHDLVRDPQRIERWIEASEQGRQHRLLVVDRNHDAEFGRRHISDRRQPLHAISINPAIRQFSRALVAPNRAPRRSSVSTARYWRYAN